MASVKAGIAPHRARKAIKAGTALAADLDFSLIIGKEAESG
jgi:hypothetical protein